MGEALAKLKERAPAHSALVVELPVTACDPLDRIRVEMWEGVLAAANLVVCALDPLLFLYHRVTRPTSQ